MVHGSQTATRTMRGIQQTLIPRAYPPGNEIPIESKGVVYTKGWVVDLLLDLAGYRPVDNLVDAIAVEPAAGNGAFLGRMIERLVRSCRKQGRPLSDCRNSLIAFELDEKSADSAHNLAVETLKEHDIEPSVANGLADGWVRRGDYLFEATNLESDFVIGNPPYVRLENISEVAATFYRKAYPTMRGRADLYVAFFEAALRQLRPDGVCAFICADRWMRNQYGAELRELVTSAYAVEVVIEMHRADAFHEEVDAYPAITIIRRQEQKRTVVASAGPEVEQIPVETLSSILQATGNGQTVMLPRGLRTAFVQTWFKGSDPWPCYSPEQLSLLRHLEERFPALESNAKVGIGVATGNDGVFITKDAGLVERSRLLKLAVVGDICEGMLKWSGHYLVDPWNKAGLVHLGEYPRLKAYYEKHSHALRKRHTAAKNVHGWYKTIDRVTHTLKDKPKLYIADIKNVLDPVLDNGETYPHHNLYFVQSNQWDLEVLGGLLMSAIVQFFIESYGVRMRGGYFRFQAQYLRRIRVPNPDTISGEQAKELIQAFRKRDRQHATRVALSIYGIDQNQLEAALGS